MRLVIAALMLIAASAGCARSRVPAPALPSSPAVDDLSALIRHGCYRCLDNAFAEAQTRGARAHAFEAAALLVLRSKELGLPYDVWLERARAFAAPDGSSSLYLDIVTAIPVDPLSDDRDALFDVATRRQAKTSLAMWRAALHEGPQSEVFRAYLEVALVCSFGTLSRNEESVSASLDPTAMAPIYQYRVGICDSTHGGQLEALRAQDPAFVDADFALGRYALDDPANPDQERALRHLESAAAAFPRSPAILTTVGNLYRAWEEWGPALAAYDTVVAVSPDHPDALLGRTISLSRLSRSKEAIDTATHLIALGQWRVGEAYYWRAWNHLLLADVDMARRDADRARMLMANAAVHVLSGTIEWRRRRMESAEQEFAQALAIDLGECEAAFNLGVVRDELGKQAAALDAFRLARQCYDLSITVRREAIVKIRSGPGSDTAKARAAAIHERVLADLAVRYDEVLQAIALLDTVTARP